MISLCCNILQNVLKQTTRFLFSCYKVQMKFSIFKMQIKGTEGNGKWREGNRRNVINMEKEYNLSFS